MGGDFGLFFKVLQRFSYPAIIFTDTELHYLDMYDNGGSTQAIRDFTSTKIVESEEL